MSAAPRKLLTLSEVSRRTGISMPTLQKYKREYAEQIPSQGSGRKQRYYLEALDVFQRLKAEGLSRRGRRAATAGSSSPAKRTPKSESKLLSLQQIKRETGISYPTLLRYVKLHLSELPHEGTGRNRRYHPEAVEVFRRLRATSKRGRKPKGQSTASATSASGSPAKRDDGALATRLARLERSQAALEKQLRELVSVLRAPMTVTVKRR